VPQPHDDQRFTVMVVPENGARSERLTLSGSHVVALSFLSRFSGQQLRTLGIVAGAVTLVLTGALAGLARHYFSVVDNVRENTELREENLRLTADVTRMKTSVTSLSDRLERVKHLVLTLQNTLQLRDVDRRLMDGGESDAGAPVDAAALADDVARLDQDADAQETSLRVLVAYVQDQHAMLASAPAIWPARGWITSEHGFRLDPYTSDRTLHAGMDIANAEGTPVVAPADGVVVYASPERDYGNVIVLDHGSGIKTRYAHLSEFAVKAGTRVRRGEPIGAMGNTGRSTGTHLHYEVRINGIPENPRKFILEDDPGAPGGYAATGMGGRGP